MRLSSKFLPFNITSTAITQKNSLQVKYHQNHRLYLTFETLCIIERSLEGRLPRKGEPQSSGACGAHFLCQGRVCGVPLRPPALPQIHFAATLNQKQSYEQTNERTKIYNNWSDSHEIVWVHQYFPIIWDISYLCKHLHECAQLPTTKSHNKCIASVYYDF